MIARKLHWISCIAVLLSAPVESAAESALGCITEAEFKGDPVSKLALNPTPPGATVRELRTPYGEAHTFDRQGRLIRTRRNTTYDGSTTTYRYRGANRLPHEIQLSGAACCNGVTRYRRNSAGFVEASESTGERARDFRYDITVEGDDVLIAPRGVTDHHRFRDGWRVERRTWDNWMLNVGGSTSVDPSLIIYRCERVENPDGTWLTIERKFEGDRSGVRELSKYDASGHMIEQWSAYLNQPLSDSMTGTVLLHRYTFDRHGNWVARTTCSSKRNDRADLSCSEPMTREIEYW